jgi:hypothetical protein
MRKRLWCYEEYHERLQKIFSASLHFNLHFHAPSHSIFTQHLTQHLHTASLTQHPHKVSSTSRAFDVKVPCHLVLYHICVLRLTKFWHSPVKTRMKTRWKPEWKQDEIRMKKDENQNENQTKTRMKTRWKTEWRQGENNWPADRTG